MKFKLKDLLESQCPNIWHHMLHAGQQIGGEVEVPDEIARRILALCGASALISAAAAPGVEPIPFQQWPLAFRLLAKAAKTEDKGLGDIIDRVVGPVGGVKFKLWFKRIIGHDCGCGARKQRLNAVYPLPKGHFKGQLTHP
jgi:hypothetical protein